MHKAQGARASAKELLANMHENDNKKERKGNISTDVSKGNADQ